MILAQLLGLMQIPILGCLRICFTCCSVFTSSAQRGDLLTRRRYAHPLPQRRHNQQEGLPHPLHEHQVPGEPSHQEMTSHTARDLWPLCSPTTVTLTFTMAKRKAQPVPSSQTHGQTWTLASSGRKTILTWTFVPLCGSTQVVALWDETGNTARYQVWTNVGKHTDSSVSHFCGGDGFDYWTWSLPHCGQRVPEDPSQFTEMLTQKSTNTHKHAWLIFWIINYGCLRNWEASTWTKTHPTREFWVFPAPWTVRLTVIRRLLVPTVSERKQTFLLPLMPGNWSL